MNRKPVAIVGVRLRNTSDPRTVGAAVAWAKTVKRLAAARERVKTLPDIYFGRASI